MTYTVVCRIPFCVAQYNGFFFVGKYRYRLEPTDFLTKSVVGESGYQPSSGLCLRKNIRSTYTPYIEVYKVGATPAVQPLQGTPLSFNHRFLSHIFTMFFVLPSANVQREFQR